MHNKGEKKHIKSFILITVLFYLLSLNIAFSQSNNTDFDNIGVEDGLKSNIVNTIYQDSYGYIWVGTANGLYKYNGYKFESYFANPDDSTKLNSNNISKIVEDKWENLWIGTMGGGLSCLNLKSNDVKTYSAKEQKDGLKIADNRIQDLTIDSSDILWIITNGKLHKYNLRNKKQIKINISSLNKKFNISDYGPKKMTLSKDNKHLIVGTWFIGIVIYDIKNDSVVDVISEEEALNSNLINSLYTDSKGRIWVGTWNGGISVFDYNYNLIRSYKNNSSYLSLSNNTINTIFEDKRNNIWIGTQNGLNRIIDNKELINVNFHRNYHVFRDDKSLANNYVNNIFQDKSGVIWIATDKGISKFSYLKEKFKYFHSIPKNKYSLPENDITDYKKAKNNKAFVSTWGNGVAFFDMDKGIFNKINNINAKYISSLYLENDLLYATTRNNGVIAYNINKKQVEYNVFNKQTSNWVRNCMPKNDSLFIGTKNNLLLYDGDKTQKVGSQNEIFSMVKDKKGQIWISGLHQSFVYYKGKFTNLKTDYQGLLYEDLKGYVWLLNNHQGVQLFNLSDTVPVKDYNIKAYTIKQDPKGNIWLGTNNGLMLFNHNTKEFSKFTTNQGLPDNTVKSIEPYKNNILWVGTNYGLSKFNYVNETFRNFDHTDGIGDNTFKKNTSLKINDTNFIFACENGMIHFTPNNIKLNSSIPPVVITSFYIENNEISIGEKIDGRTILRKSLAETSEIILPKKRNSFTVSFAALDYVAPHKNMYEYILEGFEEYWNPTNNNSATYTNLDPGEYIFMVRGSNNDGIWNNEITKIKIIIPPPFYQTWAFKIIIAILLIIMGFSFYYIKITSVRHQNAKLNEIVKQRTAEISKQKEQLDKLNHSKDKLFEVVSHELKKPLEDLLSIAKEFQEGFESYSKEQKQELLDLFEGTVNNTLELFDNMLKWTESNAGHFKIQENSIDLNKLVHKTISNYKAYARKKKIKIMAENKKCPVIGDETTIETIIRNILGNAIKYSTSGGDVKINYNERQNDYEIIFEDSGIGIEDQNIINNLEVTNINSKDGTNGEKGAGLGLLLTKEFIESNKGTINIESKVNQGTKVSITLPKDYDEESDI